MRRNEAIQAGDMRTRRLARMSPPFAAVLEARSAIGSLGVKLSPATDDGELNVALGLIPCEREAPSVGGECRELVLWFGDLAGPGRRASLMPDGLTLDGTGEEELDIRSPGCYLYEPGAALIRARLVVRVAVELGASGMDPALACLSCDRYVPTPFGDGLPDRPPRAVQPLAAGIAPARPRRGPASREDPRDRSGAG